MQGDSDPAIENGDLVTKQAFLQSSIQTMRKEMKEQGTSNGGEQFADKKEGVFGGLKRVYEGVMNTSNNFRQVPSMARRVSKKREKQIMDANRKNSTLPPPEEEQEQKIVLPNNAP